MKLKQKFTFIDLDYIFDSIKSIFIALTIAIFLRTFFFEPFRIPSASMEPNFIKGDYFFVSKFTYGVSKYSFPFYPDIFEGRKLALQKPKRGDIIVFRIKQNPDIYYIKRIIGLPGDKVQVIDGNVYVNGTLLNQNYISKVFDSSNEEADLLTETNTDGVSYQILDRGESILDNTQLFEIPQKQYFVMGDNRDQSLDSRVTQGGIGFIDEKYIIGKAQFILFSNNAGLAEIWNWPFSFKMDRFFMKVK